MASSSSTIQNPNIQIRNQISIASARLSAQEEEDVRQNTETSSNSDMTNNSSENSSSQNVTLPTIPQRAFYRIRAATSSSSSSSPTSATSEFLPTYSIVIKDMPPIYPDQTDQQEPCSSSSQTQTAGLRSDVYIEPLIHLEAPILPQEYWPITKKFYVYGFIIWPLWLIGAIYIFFGNEYKYHDQELGTFTNEENENNNNKVNTGRLKWAQRCLFNLLILTTILAYVSVALSRSKGKFY